MLPRAALPRMELRRATGWILFVLGALGVAFLLAVVLLDDGAGALGVALGLVALPFLAALPLALMLVGWRLAHPRPMEPDVPRTRARPVPVPAAEDVADLPEPISVCPDCGFLGIRMPSIGDGLWPGGGEIQDRMVCPRCEWQGLPARFDSRTEYRAWLRDLNEDRASA